MTAVDVAAWLTVCARAEDVLAVKLESLLYFAVMEWAPREREESVSCADASESFADPSEELPSKKVTLPVGIPLEED